MSLLAVHGLCKSFRPQGLWRRRVPVVRAVHEVSFQVEAGETVAIVGESGSGKSTIARLIMRLIEPDAGRIEWLGEDVTKLGGRGWRRRRRHVQMVFQDPFASLNPRMKIVEAVGEGLRVHAPALSRSQRRERVAAILEQCGLGGEVLDRYPHQFSGGQRQRIGIARALAVEPKALVLDEPVSALDVSVQAQILNLLAELKRRHRLAYVFISHDLSVVRHMADRVLVMFAGRVVEAGEVADVFGRPRHPYTRALLDARPIRHPDQRRPAPAEAPPPIADAAPTGCVYRRRCPRATSECARFDGALGDGGHACACLHPLDG